MIHIIDNRNGKADLKLQKNGVGKWYAHDEYSGYYIACKTKYIAMHIKKHPKAHGIPEPPAVWFD
jgi:hypothetical protein